MEFGLCHQDGQLKAYGAGLLSSYGELQYALSGKPELRAFEPAKTALQKYPITEYQPIYYIAESFEDAKEKMMYVYTYLLTHCISNIILYDVSLSSKYAHTIPRAFGVRYNAYTQSIDILDSKVQIEDLVRNVNGEVQILLDALTKL